MLAKQENYEPQEKPVRSLSEREALHRAARQPLYKTVINTTLRARCQIMFIAVTILAMAVTVGSGINASRGYALIEVQKEAADLEQENERLKIEIAKLKSPERIKAIASDQLGMEVPRQTYFGH